MNIHQIGLGYFLGRFYVKLFDFLVKIMSVVWILSLVIFFTFTYNPSEKELKKYPPLLSSETVQNTTSHLRYNFRVVLATFFVIPKETFPDMDKNQLDNFPKTEDALFKNPKWSRLFASSSEEIPAIQKEMVDLYRLIVDGMIKPMKDKPINNLDWNVLKDKENS